MNWTRSWFLLVSSNAWLQFSKLIFLIFLIENHLITKTALFPKALDTEHEQVDVNFRKTTTAHTWAIFMPGALWATQNDHQRHSNYKPSNSDGLPLPALTWYKDPLNLTTRNPWLATLRTQKLVCNLIRSWIIVFLLFPSKCLITWLSEPQA